MKIHAVQPVPAYKKAAMEELISFLKENANLELVTEAGSVGLNEFIAKLKNVAVEYKDKYKKQKTVQKSAQALAIGTFITARYRDAKYALAGRKYLMGLGYHNALVVAAQSSCEYARAQKNAG